MSPSTHHMCQSVTGPLTNWSAAEWRAATRYITRDDGSRFTPSDLRAAFVNELAQGHKVIPLGKPCEGFSYETGCPGHPISEAPEPEAPSLGSTQLGASPQQERTE